MMRQFLTIGNNKWESEIYDGGNARLPDSIPERLGYLDEFDTPFCPPCANKQKRDVWEFSPVKAFINWESGIICDKCCELIPAEYEDI